MKMTKTFAFGSVGAAGDEINSLFAIAFPFARSSHAVGGRHDNSLRSAGDAKKIPVTGKMPPGRQRPLSARSRGLAVTPPVYIHPSR